MIIHRNYIPSALPKGTDIAELTASVIGPLTGIVENSGIEQDGASALRVHLDWIQYKSSFRDHAALAQCADLF